MFPYEIDRQPANQIQIERLPSRKRDNLNEICSDCDYVINCPLKDKIDPVDCPYNLPSSDSDLD